MNDLSTKDSQFCRHRLRHLVGVCARNLEVSTKQLNAIHTPRTARRHQHQRHSSASSESEIIATSDNSRRPRNSGQHSSASRRNSSSVDSSPLLPLAEIDRTSSSSLVLNDSVFLDTFFTISVSRRWRVTDAPVSYASKIIKNSKNPTWEPLDLSGLPSAEINASNNILVRIWSLNQMLPEYSNNVSVRLLLEWQLDFSGLAFVCKEDEIYSCTFPSNTILLTFEDGSVYTAPEIIEKTRRGNVAAEVSHSMRSSAVMKECCTISEMKTIMELHKRIVQCQQNLTAMHKKSFGRDSRENFILREELLNRIEYLQGKIGDRQSIVEVLQTRKAGIRQRLEQRRSILNSRSYICNDLRRQLSEFESQSCLLSNQLTDRQIQVSRCLSGLIEELLRIYPMQEVFAGSGRFSIRQIPLITVSEAIQSSDSSPLVSTSNDNDPEISTAMGYTAHVIMIVAKLLEVPLRFPIVPMSSRSQIVDFVTALYQYQESIIFPLYSKGVEHYRYEYAVFLLNKNIEQLLNFIGIFIADLRPTLANLNLLLKSLRK